MPERSAAVIQSLWRQHRRCHVGFRFLCGCGGFRMSGV